MLRLRAKALMRRRFRSHRAGLPRSAAAQRSAALCRRLLSLPEVQDAQRIALFSAIARFNEVDLQSVDAALRARDRVIAYPRTEDDRHMTFRVAAPSDMEMTGFGFLSPRAGAEVIEALDVIVVPGLAFDARGYRIGYGGGYYDRALSHAQALTIGVAFDFQLAAEIPNTDGDVPVAMIVTDARLLDTRPARD